VVTICTNSLIFNNCTIYSHTDCVFESGGICDGVMGGNVVTAGIVCERVGGICEGVMGGNVVRAGIVCERVGRKKLCIFIYSW
jgi:hypothetical protein